MDRLYGAVRATARPALPVATTSHEQEVVHRPGPKVWPYPAPGLSGPAVLQRRDLLEPLGTRGPPDEDPGRQGSRIWRREAEAPGLSVRGHWSGACDGQEQGRDGRVGAEAEEGEAVRVSLCVGLGMRVGFGHGFPLSQVSTLSVVRDFAVCSALHARGLLHCFVLFCSSSFPCQPVNLSASCSQHSSVVGDETSVSGFPLTQYCSPGHLSRPRVQIELA